MKIFHIRLGNNGAQYTFYDQYGHIIKDHNIKSLAEADSYHIEGTPEWDKFYEVATDNAGNILCNEQCDWGLEEIHIVTGKSIGSGKLNTKKLLAAVSMMQKQGYPQREKLFKWIAELNLARHNNFKDWYIPSSEELKKLNSSRVGFEYIMSKGLGEIPVWTSTFQDEDTDLDPSKDDITAETIVYSYNENKDGQTYCKLRNQYLMGIAIRSF